MPLDAISGRPRRAASLGGRDHWIADADSVVVIEQRDGLHVVAAAERDEPDAR